MEIYRELYQISKSLSEFTAKARRLHQIMSEPTKLEPGEVVRFDQSDWEQEFDRNFAVLYQTYGATTRHDLPYEIKQFIRDLLAQQRLQDSIEPEEV
jgi:hypothetical protein